MVGMRWNDGVAQTGFSISAEYYRPIPRLRFGRLKWWKALAIGGGFSILIEVLQFVFKRGFAEFDDVFHNVLGCAIGFGVYVGVRWLIRQISPLAGARSE